MEVLKRKDACPYEWVDFYDKFKHSSLTQKKYFYSSLRDFKRDRSDGHISDEQYEHLQNDGRYLILILSKIFMIIT